MILRPQAALDAMALHAPGLWREQVHWAAAIAVGNLLVGAITPPGGAVSYGVTLLLMETVFYVHLVLRSMPLRAVPQLSGRPSITVPTLAIYAYCLPILFCAMRGPPLEGPSQNSLSFLIFVGVTMPLFAAGYARCVTLFQLAPSLIAWGGSLAGMAIVFVLINALGYGDRQAEIWKMLFAPAMIALSVPILVSRLANKREPGARFAAILFFPISLVVLLFLVGFFLGGVEMVVQSGRNLASPLAPNYVFQSPLLTGGVAVLADFALWPLRWVHILPEGHRILRSARTAKPLGRIARLSAAFALRAPALWRDGWHFLLACLAGNTLIILGIYAFARGAETAMSAGLFLVLAQALFYGFVLLRSGRLREIEPIARRPSMTSMAGGLCLLALPFVAGGQPEGSGAPGLNGLSVMAGIGVAFAIAGFVRSVILFRLIPAIVAGIFTFVVVLLGAGVVTVSVRTIWPDNVDDAGLFTAFVEIGALVLLLIWLGLNRRRRRASELVAPVVLWLSVALPATIAIMVAARAHAPSYPPYPPVTVLGVTAIAVIAMALLSDVLALPVQRQRVLPGRK